MEFSLAIATTEAGSHRPSPSITRSRGFATMDGTIGMAKATSPPAELHGRSSRRASNVLHPLAREGGNPDVHSVAEAGFTPSPTVRIEPSRKTHRGVRRG
jgi:hypothetical protein